MKKTIMLIMLVAATINAAVVYDDFDDGSLSSDWAISGVNVDSYTLDESGSEVSLDSLVPEDNTQKWTNLYLSRTFDALTGEFHIDFEQSYRQSHAEDMPYAQLWLYAGGSLRGYAGIADGNPSNWGNPLVYLASGNPVTYAGDAFAIDDYVGSLSWDIDRDAANLITVSLEGTPVLTATDASAIDEVRITFQGRSLSWVWDADDPSMKVDLVNVVPEPASLVLLALGAVVIKRKK
jgi:hypothetical protein